MFLFLAFFASANETADFMAKVKNLITKKSYTQAIKVSTDLIEEQGMIDADPLLFNYRGIANFHLGKYNEAIRDLTQFIYASGTDQKTLKAAYSYRGQCNLIIGNLEDATIDAEKSGNSTLIKSVKSTKFQIELAEKSISENNQKEALEHYNKTLRFAPYSAQYLVKAAECALKLGNSAAFDELSHRIFKIDAKNPMYLMLVGLDAFEKNDLKLAQSRFKKCNTNNKCIRLLKATNRLIDHRSQASRLIRQNKYEEAAPHMNQCLEIVNTFAKPDSNVTLSIDLLNVKVLLKKGKQNEALDTLNTLIKSYPNSTELRLDRGEILIDLADYDGAIVDFSFVTRKDEHNRRAQAGLKKASELRDKEKHQDYYEVLGVKKGCSQKELKDAFRKCVNTWHPDRYKDPMKKKEAEKKMKMINKAMDVLSDPQKRKMYDAGYDPESGMPPPPPDDDQQQQYYQQGGPQGGFYQQGGPQGGYYQQGGPQGGFYQQGGPQGGFFGGGGANNPFMQQIFEQMMRGGGGGFQQQQQQQQQQRGGGQRKQQRNNNAKKGNQRRH